MLRWARAHHLTRSTGHRGDVVVWGNGTHVGIYRGNGKAIRSLTSGVQVLGLRVLNTRFTTFISTGLSGAAAPAKPATAPAASRPKVVARRTVAFSRLNFRSAPRVTAAACASSPAAHGSGGPLRERRGRPDLVPGGRRDTGRLGRRLADAPRGLTFGPVAGPGLYLRHDAIALRGGGVVACRAWSWWEGATVRRAGLASRTGRGGWIRTTDVACIRRLL